MMMIRSLQRLVNRVTFSNIRCDSESSVALTAAVSSNTLSLKRQPNTEEKGGKDNNSKMNKTQSQASFSQGRLHRIFRRFKSFSQLFVYKEKMEHVEKEMEIGLPTDVKHVAHIGTDTINQVSNWEILSFPSISLQQFEVAMAAQSHAPPSTTIN